MNGTCADSAAPVPAGLQPPPVKRGAGWSRQKWLAFTAVVFAAQVALIFVLGDKQFPPPRTVTNVPQLTLADNSSELIALGDPTLFVLPHANDFASSVWLQTPGVQPPVFRWTETPRWLPLSTEVLGAVFARFMQTNQFAGFQPDFKAPPKLSAPVAPFQPAFAENSTLRIEGDLAQRRLLTPIDLPSLSYPDVIAPSKVQALVDAAGNVVSAVLLPSDNAVEAAGRADAGDTNALQIARTLRFAPASHLTVGKLIFTWRTVPLPATNAPARRP